MTIALIYLELKMMKSERKMKTQQLKQLKISTWTLEFLKKKEVKSKRSPNSKIMKKKKVITLKAKRNNKFENKLH